MSGPRPRHPGFGWENDGVTSVPIACTLSADAVGNRVAEWRRFLATMVQQVDHQANNVTLTLLGGRDAVLTAVDLAQREKACCSFFEFSIDLDGTETRLTIDVPAEADPILNELLALAPAHLRHSE